MQSPAFGCPVGHPKQSVSHHDCQRCRRCRAQAKAADFSRAAKRDGPNAALAARKMNRQVSLCFMQMTDVFLRHITANV